MDLTYPANSAGSPGGYWVGMGGLCGMEDVTLGDGLGRVVNFGMQTPHTICFFFSQNVSGFVTYTYTRPVGI